MTVSRRGFLTGGTWCLDRNRFIERWPEEDRLATAWGLEEEAGGSAANLALAIRRLDPDMPVATLALCGDDAFGTIMKDIAEAAGIDISGFRLVPGASTHSTECFVSKATGRRTHITDIGIGNDLSPEHFSFDGRTERFFHLGLPGVHRTLDASDENGGNGWKTVLQRAQAAGFLTSLELVTLPPSEQRQIAMPCLQHVDHLVINDSEIAALADMPTQIGGSPQRDLCIAAAEAVMEIGNMRVIAIHSPQGGVCVMRDGSSYSAPSLSIPESEIAGPNGAGDGFASGFLYGLHEGWKPEECLRLGHAVATASLRSTGTTSGITDWRGCLALGEKWPPRKGSWEA